MAAGTAMKIDRALLGLVPVGEENAVTARLLWQVNRLGAVATVKFKLNMMASEGLVQRKRIGEVLRKRRSIGGCRKNLQAKPLPLGPTIGGCFALGLEEH